MTESELAAMRADAEAVAAAKAALVGRGHTHDAPRWQVEYFVNPHGGPNSGIWHITNEDPDARERFDLFESAPEEYCRLLCEYRNRPLDGHVLALLAEVDRLRAREDALVADVEMFGGAMRQIVLGRVGEPAPLRELLERMAREADTAPAGGLACAACGTEATRIGDSRAIWCEKCGTGRWVSKQKPTEGGMP